MRVLSGRYKGKKLLGSKDNSIRPTTNKIKEYIFNILQDYCEDKVAADIFCGSGNLGIESLSRGSKYLVFVDNSQDSLKILKSNLNNVQIDQNLYQVVQKDAIKFCQEFNNKFDLIFMDPPFYYPPINDLLSSIFKNEILIENGILVVEHEISNPVNLDNEYFEIFKQKKIGRSLISFIIKRRSKSA